VGWLRWPNRLGHRPARLSGDLLGSGSDLLGVDLLGIQLLGVDLTQGLVGCGRERSGAP